MRPAPYNYQNFDIDGKAYYTNNPPAGAFRGFGVTQTCFAIEMLLTKWRKKIGISPWEIRYRNAIRPGQELPNGQLVDNATGLAETLEAVKEAYESHPYAGIACAMKTQAWVWGFRTGEDVACTYMMVVWKSIPARRVLGRTRHGARADACGAALP